MPILVIANIADISRSMQYADIGKSTGFTHADMIINSCANSFGFLLLFFSPPRNFMDITFEKV